MRILVVFQGYDAAAAGMLQQVIDVADLLLAATTHNLPIFCVRETELTRSTRQRRCKLHVRASATNDAHEPLRTLRESHELVPMRLQDAFFSALRRHRFFEQQRFVTPNGTL